jgi:N-acetylornithine carbamoyltransferase
MSLSGRHFYSTLDFRREELLSLLDLAARLKKGDSRIDLQGRLLILMFFNPSVRTRVSFEAAMARMNGRSLVLHPGADTWQFEHRPGIVMDGAGQEHVKELAPVLSRYGDAVGIRKSELVTTAKTTAAVSESYEELRKDVFLRAFMEHAKVPVINCESNAHHPCQGLADAQTLRERFREPRGRKYAFTWAWHPKSLPVATPHSQVLAPCLLGMDVTLVYPEGYDLDPEVTNAARRRAEEAGGRLSVSHDPVEGLRGADVVCAKAYGSLRYYGRFDQEAKDKERHRADWMLTTKRMAATNDAVFMHCLPVRRNVVVEDAILDSPRSIVVDEAENRVWAQMAIVASLLGAAR